MIFIPPEEIPMDILILAICWGTSIYLILTATFSSEDDM